MEMFALRVLAWEQPIEVVKSPFASLAGQSLEQSGRLD